jgi:hypothetical protein
MAMWNRRLGRLAGCAAETCFDAACHGCGDGLGFSSSGGHDLVLDVLDPRGVRRFHQRHDDPATRDEQGVPVDFRAVSKAAKRHGYRVVRRVVYAWGGEALWVVEGGRVLVLADIPGPPGAERVRPGDQVALWRAA